MFAHALRRNQIVRYRFFSACVGILVLLASLRLARLGCELRRGADESVVLSIFITPLVILLPDPCADSVLESVPLLFQLLL